MISRMKIYRSYINIVLSSIYYRVMFFRKRKKKIRARCLKSIISVRFNCSRHFSAYDITILRQGRKDNVATTGARQQDTLITLGRREKPESRGTANRAIFTRAATNHFDTRDLLFSVETHESDESRERIERRRDIKMRSLGVGVNIY